MRYLVPRAISLILVIAAGALVMIAAKQFAIAFGKVFLFLIHLIY
jgi:hypothetical protein